MEVHVIHLCRELYVILQYTVRLMFTSLRWRRIYHPQGPSLCTTCAHSLLLHPLESA